MRYLCLLVGEPDVEVPVPGTPEFMQMLSDYESATRAMAAAGVLVDSGPLPSDPSGWLITVAKNHAVDRLRREAPPLRQGAGRDAAPGPFRSPSPGRDGRRRPAPAHLRLLPSGPGSWHSRRTDAAHHIDATLGAWLAAAYAAAG